LRNSLLIVFLILCFSICAVAQNTKFISIRIGGTVADRSQPMAFDLYIYAGSSLEKVFTNLQTDTLIRITGTNGQLYKASIHSMQSDEINFYWKFDTIRANLTKTIILQNKAILLKDVNVKAQRESYQRGDTLFIPVDSIKTMPHANATELMNKIPGAAVSENGNVTMLGKKVDKITVDGMEVFGGNPKATLENLRADMLKDVQVINTDGNSGNGIEINLKLRKDKKNGIYGEVYDQQGTGSKVNSGFKFNEISPGSFLNSFFNYNNQNQQVLSPFDYFQIVGTTIDDDNTLGTQKLYYDNKLEDPFNSINKIGDLFPFLQKGLHKTFSGGVNQSKNYKKLSWTSYLLGSYDQSFVNSFSNTVRSLGDVDSHDLENTLDHSSAYDFIGQSSLKWVPNDKNTVSGKIIFERKHLKENPNDLLNSSLYSRSDSLINSLAINSDQQVTNTNNLFLAKGNWEHRYDRPAEKTTLSGGLVINQTGYDNVYLNELSESGQPVNYNDQIIQNSTNYNYFANIEHSRPLSRKLLIDFRISSLFSSNLVNRTGEDIMPNQAPLFSPQLSINDFHMRNNQIAAQSFLFYKTGHLSIIGSLGALATNWLVWSRDTTYNHLNKTAFLPGLYVAYGTGRSKLSFRFIREQATPLINTLLPVTDSSKIQQVSMGNPTLSPYLTNRYEINSDVFIKGLGTINFQFNYSVSMLPVTNNYILGDGIYPLLSYDQYEKAQTITGSIAYIKVDQSALFNPYIFLFYLSQHQYQLNQQIATPIDFNAISPTIGVKMNITKEHTLNMSVQSTLSNTRFAGSGSGTTDRFNLELRDDNRISEGLYYKFSTKWVLVSSNGSYDAIKPVTSFNFYQYIGKQRNWQINCGINNLFNVDEIKLVSAGITQRSESSYNYLSRYANVGLTFYPEKWKQ
jgi:hypothetical protein